ncbi:MAG: peptidylprolyl isomerase [Magnetococcales bacterium]|nr:peptidylprolyl isomerase [Magnetococcales bacterium]
MLKGRVSCLVLTTVLACGVALGAAKTVQAAPAAADKSAVLATMGSVNLTVTEFQNLMNYSDKEVKAQLLANPELMKQKISEAIVRKTVVAKAKEQKWDQKAEVAFLMERAKEGLLIDHFLKNAAKPAGKFPEESMVQQAYEENKARFMMPATIHLSQIFLKFDEKMDEKAKQDLGKIAEKYAAMILKKESDFATMAKKYSQHQPSAAQGGDMGWVPTAQLLPEFKKAVEGLKSGEVSGVVKSAQGYHILQFQGAKDAAPRPYEQVKPTLTQMLKSKKLQENKDAYLMDLVKKQPITLNESNRALLK